MGLRLGEEAEQLLRVRHRQRSGACRRTTSSSSTTRSGCRRARRPRRRLSPSRARRCSAAHRGRRQAFRPASVVNISAMSFGSLSSRRRTGPEPWRRALPAACTTPVRAGSLPTTSTAGDLIWQLGTGYFGARGAGRPASTWSDSPDQVAADAGPGHRDQAQPGRQARPRRRAARGEGHGRDRRHPGRAPGQTVISPSGHTAFRERRRAAGLRRDARRRAPACRSASSPRSASWGSGRSSRDRMASRGPRRRLHHDRRRRGRDRGGAVRRSRTTSRCPSRSGSAASTGSSPSANVHHASVWIGRGKLGFPESALLAFCLGADMVTWPGRP